MGADILMTRRMLLTLQPFVLKKKTIIIIIILFYQPETSKAQALHIVNIGGRYRLLNMIFFNGYYYPLSFSLVYCLPPHTVPGCATSGLYIFRRK